MAQDPNEDRDLSAGILSRYNSKDFDTAAPLGIPSHDNFNQNSLWELSSDDIIELVEHILRGHKKKRDGTYDTTNEKKFRLMNDEGIFRTVTAMQMILNKNTYLSNFDEPKTFEMIRHFSVYYAEILSYNYILFDLDVDYIDYIHELVTGIVAYAIQRQMGGGERSLRTQPENIQRVIRQDMPMPAGQMQQKKRGLFGLGLAGL